MNNFLTCFYLRLEILCHSRNMPVSSTEVGHLLPELRLGVLDGAELVFVIVSP